MKSRTQEVFNLLKSGLITKLGLLLPGDFPSPFPGDSFQLSLNLNPSLALYLPLSWFISILLEHIQQ